MEIVPDTSIVPVLVDSIPTFVALSVAFVAAAEVGEAEMKTDDGKFTGLQASRYGSSASLVLTFSGKDGVTTTADFAAALGYTADLTTDAKTGTMTYDAAKAGKAGTDVQVELSAGTAIAGTTDTSIFSSTATVATDISHIKDCLSCFSLFCQKTHGKSISVRDRHSVSIGCNGCSA